MCMRSLSLSRSLILLFFSTAVCSAGDGVSSGEKKILACSLLLARTLQRFLSIFLFVIRYISNTVEKIEGSSGTLLFDDNSIRRAN